MSPRKKHIPQRRCVTCGAQLPQRELVRIVKTSEGDVAVDQGHRKQPGRGAYLCHKAQCWEHALRRNRLDHALRATVSTREKEQLREFAHSRLERV